MYCTDESISPSPFWLYNGMAFFPISGMPFTPTRRFRFRQSDTVCPASYFIIPTMAVIMPSRCFRYRFSSWVSNTFGLISPPAKQFIGKFRPKTNMYGVYPVCIISDWFRARHADLKASFHDNDLSPCVRQNIPFFIIADVLSTTTICADSPAGLVTSTTSEILLYSCHSSDSSPGPPSRNKYRGRLQKNIISSRRHQRYVERAIQKFPLPLQSG